MNLGLTLPGNLRSNVLSKWVVHMNVCPACNCVGIAEKFFSVKKDYSLADYAYNRCSGCGTIYLNDPALGSQEELTEFHAKHWYASDNFTYQKVRDIREKIEKSIEHAKKIIIATNCEDKDLFLDIGCGEGELVAAFHRIGFKAYGIEPNVQEFAAAQIMGDLQHYLISVSLEDFILHTAHSIYYAKQFLLSTPMFFSHWAEIISFLLLPYKELLRDLFV